MHILQRGSGKPRESGKFPSREIIQPVPEWAPTGNGPSQFNLPHTITSDAQDRIWVGDRGNRRIQVFDTDLNLIKTITSVGAPWRMCTTPGPTQYVYSGDSNGKIYKVDMDGKVIGWAQTSLGLGQTSCLVHQLVCESEKVLIKGDCSTWKVEKITFK